MGSKTRMRGFSDGNGYWAQTTQPSIAAMTNRMCDNNGNNCQDYTTRWTYAIPLEIVYMTPLLSWNPYNITYKGREKNDWYKSVTKNGRNGGLTQEKAYDGINSGHYFMTPAEFFNLTDAGAGDAADTSGGVTGVLDSEGNLREVVSSGHKILLDPIPDVGTVRTRYPIAPLHNDGSQILKELEALKDIVTQSHDYSFMYQQMPTFGSSPLDVSTISMSVHVS